jgi:hypothetical protein
LDYDAAAATKNDPETTSIHSASTTLSDLLDIDVDPVRLRSILLNIITALETLARRLDDLLLPTDWTDTHADESSAAHRDAPLAHLRDACRSLFDETCKLEATVMAYASSRSTDRAGLELDPGLYKWANDCSVCLLMAQAALGVEDGGASKAEADSELGSAGDGGIDAAMEDAVTLHEEEKFDGEDGGDAWMLVDTAAQTAGTSALPDAAELVDYALKLEDFRATLVRFHGVLEALVPHIIATPYPSFAYPC